MKVYEVRICTTINGVLSFTAPNQIDIHHDDMNGNVWAYDTKDKNHFLMVPGGNYLWVDSTVKDYIDYD